MSGVRVLAGTRKGAFLLTSDEARKRWDVSGPHFPGWEIYHLKASPADPNRIYASQSNAWFGQVLQRSDDGGRTWQTVGNEFRYEGEVEALLPDRELVIVLRSRLGFLRKQDPPA